MKGNRYLPILLAFLLLCLCACGKSDTPAENLEEQAAPASTPLPPVQDDPSVSGGEDTDSPSEEGSQADKEQEYADAIAAIISGDYDKATVLLNGLNDYQRSSDLIRYCRIQTSLESARKSLQDGDYAETYQTLGTLPEIARKPRRCTGTCWMPLFLILTPLLKHMITIRPDSSSFSRTTLSI